MSQYTADDIRRIIAQEDVKFLRLQFVDVIGTLKNVAITVEQLDKALEGNIPFDGSSIEGFVRMEESDMYLKPDLNTFELFPWRPNQGKVARLICDVYTTEDEPFDGDPRGVLKRAIAEAKKMGYELDLGPEFEFFLFHTDEQGDPTTTTHDNAGYFDLGPVDLGENVRRDMVLSLESMGFDIKASHHEVAPGQHEIDFEAAEALKSADNIVTFKLVVKVMAQKHGLHATFMPKPLYGINGSGLHLNMKLFNEEGKNVFYDGTNELKLSKTAHQFMAGLIRHAKAITAVTNPTVNSYKRLVPGFEAPIFIGWSTTNVSPLIRIPKTRGSEAIIELRSPDPSCNPYLAIAVILMAGLSGIKEALEAPAMMSEENLSEVGNILSENTLPSSLKEALVELSKDEVIRAALGNVYDSYMKAKSYEWEEYVKQVHPWEIDNYISRY